MTTEQMIEEAERELIKKFIAFNNVYADKAELIQFFSEQLHLIATKSAEEAMDAMY